MSVRIGGQPQAWGARSQIGGTVQELKDLVGNKDGVWGNERKPAGTTGDFFDTNPAALKVRAALSTGVSAGDEIKLLAGFVAEREAAWGKPVMDPAIKAELSGGDLFAAQKAIALTRYDRDPADVTERFVSAKGAVDGAEVPEARVFTQHFRPIGEPTGDVVVMSPGFLETGRAFLDQVDRLCQAGAHVVVMDHQWAGHTEGKKGGIASGESVALHTTAVLADAAELGRELYGDKLQLAVVGESMGGGPGAFGGLLMAQAGRLSLEGKDAKALTADVDLFLQAPYFGATPTILNSALTAAASIPVLNRLAAPGVGLPDFVDDPKGEHLVAQGMVLEDIRGQTQAFKASNAFLSKVLDAVDAGARTGGRVIVAHDDQDPLADFSKSTALVDKLGGEGELVRLTGGDHGLSASDPEVIGRLIAHLAERRER